MLTKYTSTSCLSISSPNKSAYLLGLSGKKGAPKQVENYGSGSVTPRSVPANLEVKPLKKWYIA